jgi:flagellin-like hook-associated protein FlgL
MSDIVLSAGVRQNLLSLQNTAQLMTVTQNRLATGKKVNTAQDNPTNFFTSQSLQSRAGDLNSLLDSIGQAQQTITAANQGITSLSSLIQSAISTAKQAQQSATAGFTYDLTAATGTATINADTTRTTSSSALTSVAGGLTGSQVGNVVIDASNVSGLSDGDTITVKYGSGATKTYTFKGTAPNAGAGEFNDAASLTALLQTDFGAGSVSNSSGTITISGNDYTTPFTVGGNIVTGSELPVTNNAAVDGSKLTLNDGTNTATLRYVTANANAGAGTFTTIADLTAAIAASSVAATTTGTNASGKLQLDTPGSITVGGAVGTALGFAAPAYTNANAAYNNTLAALTGTVSLTVGNGTAQTLTFGGTGITTKAGLTTALAGITGVTAAVDGSNHIAFSTTSNADLTIAGTGSVLTALGLTANTYTPAGTLQTADPTRASLQNDFDNLLTQIDGLAKDASYNGVNLIYGDNLKVVFNENGTSLMTLQGVKFDSAGLGLSAPPANTFQNNASIDTVITGLNNALSTLRAQASKFGSNLTTVQTRQDFTKNLINTLQTGADNLVLADSNEEGANMLALQTRQQLSTTALSLSAQSDQAVLRLFQ